MDSQRPDPAGDRRDVEHDPRLTALWLEQMQTFTDAAIAQINADPDAVKRLAGVNVIALASSADWLSEDVYYLAATDTPPFDDQGAVVDILVDMWASALYGTDGVRPRRIACAGGRAPRPPAAGQESPSKSEPIHIRRCRAGQRVQEEYRGVQALVVGSNPCAIRRRASVLDRSRPHRPSSAAGRSYETSMARSKPRRFADPARRDASESRNR